jgi:hypothetical protein
MSASGGALEDQRSPAQVYNGKKSYHPGMQLRAHLLPHTFVAL